ncbi:Clp protease N-terminal domain-containing protein [Streptosporangium sp. NPDC001681]|uniref:Clp protease N-terminal domain-containing protein n=1 Tax=Streptosporangium sp. NPDC001681 TaxID=3154395 RepID=UPI003321EE80
MRRVWRRRKVLRMPLDRLLTENATQVLDLAKEEAAAHRHGQVSSEHLLLALTRFDAGIASAVLIELGIDPQDVRTRVEQRIGQGDHEPTGEVSFARQGERILELSRHEAAQLGNVHIGTEHLLLGLIREGQGNAASVLARLGADLPETRRGVIRVLIRDTEAQQA